MDAQTWGLLLSAPVVLSILALLFREPVWRHLLAFSVGALVTGVATSVYNVYVLKRIDPKFYQAPDGALELEVGLLSILVAISTVVLGVSFAALRRFGTRRLRSHALYIIFALGALYTLVQLFIGNIILAWAWILLFPVLCAWLVLGRSQMRVN